MFHILQTRSCLHLEELSAKYTDNYFHCIFPIYFILKHMHSTINLEETSETER